MTNENGWAWIGNKNEWNVIANGGSRLLTHGNVGMCEFVDFHRSCLEVVSDQIYTDGFDAELVFNECDWFGCAEWDDDICDWWKPGGAVGSQPMVCDDAYDNADRTE